MFDDALSGMTMLPEFMPPVLARLPQWVYWRHIFTPDGRLTKVPYQIENWRKHAASTRPEEWSVYEQAKENWDVAECHGVGFVFAQNGGVFGIDVDDLEKLAPEDQEAGFRLRVLIKEHFPTYREVSPSGRGCHYIGFGQLPEGIASIKDSKYGIEIYDRDRFFTFTGKVIDGKTDLLNCQDALNDLCHTMRGAQQAARASYSNTIDPRPIEQIISDIAGWSNGTEFVKLMHDPLTVTLSRYKNDHSAADMALANFIGAASKDIDKAVEIFRRSPLWREGGKGGYRPETKYISDYIVTRCLGKVWGEQVEKEKHREASRAEGERAANAILANAQTKQEPVENTGSSEKPKKRDKLGTYAKKYGIDLPYLDFSDTSIPLPPGNAGEFVRAILAACATPVPDFAIAVGMAYLSGLLGRAYHFRGNGLNTFFMVGAKSATGKTQHIGAMQRLLGSVTETQLVERAYAISAKTVQGIHPFFEKYPAGAWITDECGAQVKALTDPTTQTDHELKDAINSLYDAAMRGKKWSPPASVRSNKEDKAISCLSASIAWLTTEDKIHRALNDKEIADGFLSRFIPVLYSGTLGEDNDNVIYEFPDHVKRILTTLWGIVVENDMHMPITGVANNNKTVKVEESVDARHALQYFSSEARILTRRAQNEQDDVPESFVAMARVAISAQRLAATCAVMDNPVNPIVTLEHVQWAIQLVGTRMLTVLELMQTGVIGSGDIIEMPTIIRVMKRLVLKYGAQVPSWALHDKLRLLHPFKDARIGPMNAVKQALNLMVEDGRLTREQIHDGNRGRPVLVYSPTADGCWEKDF